MPSKLLQIAGPLLLACLLGCRSLDTTEARAIAWADDASGFLPPGPLERQLWHGEFVLRIYRSDNTGEGAFEITQRGLRVYARHGYRFYLGRMEGAHETEPVSMGRDVTGDGRPNLVVYEYTGGAHCCSVFHLFEIGREFRKLDELEAGHGDAPGFEDLDGMPGLEFVHRDWTFAYWKASFADSPAPRVVLKFRDGRYALAPELMRTPPPASWEISSLARKVRNECEINGNAEGLHVDLWDSMLDLVYGGHADQAWEFYDQAWPTGLLGKEVFLQEFRAKLAGSPYWEELRAMNGIGD